MSHSPENFNNLEAKIAELERENAELKEENANLKRQNIGKDEIIDIQKTEIADKTTENEILARDLEDVSEITENLLEKFKFDPVTKLETRNAFMLRVSNTLDASFGLSPHEEVSEEDWKELLASIAGDQNKMNELENKFLAFGDVSYLSVANRGGRHDQGDMALLNVATGLKEKTIGAGRMSGDEYAAILTGKVEDVTEKIELIEDSVNKLEAVPNLKKNNLKLNIDFGLANLAEVLRVFQKFEEDNIEKRNTPRIIKRELGDIWVKIADKRSSLKKAKSRISLMMDREIAGEQFLSELVKGAYNIGLSDIRLFIDREKNGEDRHKIIKDFIALEEHKAISGEETDYSRAQAEIVWELVKE